MSIPINIASENISRYAKEVPGLNLIFNSMESIERWVVVPGQDQGFTSEFRRRIHKLKKDDVLRIGKFTDELLWILFFMPTSTAFYLQRELSNVYDEANLNDMLLDRAVEVMNANEIKDKRHAQVFLDRCNHLNASSFLTSLVNKQFVGALQRAIGRTNSEAGNVY